MWLAASMNFLRVGYQFSGGATSIDVSLQLTVALLSLVWNCVFLVNGFFVQLVPPLELMGFDLPPSEIVGFLQQPSELVGSIVLHLEMDYFAVAIEYLVVVLHIQKFLIFLYGR